MAFTEIILTDAPDQTFTTLLSNQRCTFRFRYNVTGDFWSFDLKIGNDERVTGRRVVTGVDLLAAFNLGIGSIAAISYSGERVGRTSLSSRRVKLYHISEA